jgi:hypothetical protein
MWPGSAGTGSASVRPQARALSRAGTSGPPPSPPIPTISLPRRYLPRVRAPPLAVQCQTFISRAHEKGCYGAGTPGPATAKPYNGLGAQPLSTRTSSPRMTFGTGKVRVRAGLSTRGGVG